MEKGYRLQKPERDLITKFVNELPQQLAFFVRTASVKSFKDALQQAKLGEAYGYRTNPTTVAAVQIGEKNNPNRDDQIFKMMQTITEQLEKLETPRRERPKNMRNYSQDRADVRTCQNCSGEGHLQRICHWNGNGGKRPHAKCQLCQQQGYIATDCQLHKSVPNRNRSFDAKNGQRPG